MSYADQIKKIKDDEEKLRKMVLESIPIQYHGYLYFGTRNEKIGPSKSISQEEESLGAYLDRDKEAVYYPSLSPYFTIAGRIKWFVEDHFRAGKKYKIKESFDFTNSICQVIITSEIYGETTGTAEIKKDSKTGVDARNPIENGATSAIGRALILMGYGNIPMDVTSYNEVITTQDNKTHKDMIDNADNFDKSTKSVDTTNTDTTKNTISSKIDTSNNNSKRITAINDIRNCIQVLNISNKDVDVFIKKSLNLTEYKGTKNLSDEQIFKLYNYFKTELLHTINNVFKFLNLSETQLIEYISDILNINVIDSINNLTIQQLILVYNILKNDKESFNAHKEETSQEEFNIVKNPKDVEESFTAHADNSSFSINNSASNVTNTSPPFKTEPTPVENTNKSNNVETLSKLSKDDLLNRVRDANADREKNKIEIKELLDMQESQKS